MSNLPFNYRSLILTLLLVTVCNSTIVPFSINSIFAQTTTAITYQGKLVENGNSVNANYDLSSKPFGSMPFANNKPLSRIIINESNNMKFDSCKQTNSNRNNNNSLRNKGN